MQAPEDLALGAIANHALFPQQAVARQQRSPCPRCRDAIRDGRRHHQPPQPTFASAPAFGFPRMPLPVPQYSSAILYQTGGGAHGFKTRSPGLGHPAGRHAAGPDHPAHLLRPCRPPRRAFSPPSTAASRSSLPPCRPGGGHRAISWHPTIDKQVERYAIEQRLLQLRSENAQLRRENARLAELDSRIAALLSNSSSSSTQDPPAAGNSPT